MVHFHMELMIKGMKNERKIPTLYCQEWVWSTILKLYFFPRAFRVLNSKSYYQTIKISFLPILGKINNIVFLDRFFTNIAFFTRMTFITVIPSHIFHLLSFVKVLFRRLGQSNPPYLLSHDIYFLNVYTQKLKNLCVKEAKKTCQVLFFKVEARIKNFSFAFCSKFVIFNPKIKLYQTI